MKLAVTAGVALAVWMGSGAEAFSASRVFVVAGSGESAVGGNGMPATDTGGWFGDLVTLPHGELLVTSSSQGTSGLVRRVDAHGVITTVAGNGSTLFAEPLGDGEPATSVKLSPAGLAVMPDGSLLISSGNRVRLVNSRGLIFTIAGGLETPPGPPHRGSELGDGGPATSASLSEPAGLAPLPGGGFLIADPADNLVRRVDARGIITTVAGTGAPREGGDGGPATRAGLFEPEAVAVLPHGGFLIADHAGRRVRRVDARGIITTVAGGGPERDREGKLGDGGPARRATLFGPSGLAVLPDGGFLIADGERVRRVDRSGVIATLAGAPQEVTFGNVTFAAFPAEGPWSGLSSGLGGIATSARISATAIALAQDGSVVIGGGTHVLMLPIGRRPPLAVSLRPPGLRAGVIYLNLATSQPGRARIEVRSASNAKLIAALTRALPAGIAAVRLPRLPGGELIVHVTLRGGGRVATDEAAIVSGSVLPGSLARGLIARIADAAQTEKEPPASVISCHRFGPARVDCAWGFRGRCNDVVSTTLRNALVYLTDTNSCHYSRRLRDPHGPSMIAQVL